MEFSDQLMTLARRLEQTNAALLVWDRIEAQKRLPRPERGEPIARPPLNRRALKLQLILLLADLSRFEQEISAAPALLVHN
ncbi:MAG TPA: hypothetical protein VK457_18155 [Chloroflexota bacterium]|nr:hypothetical protein [Chloroflexota bacterium]